MGFLFYKLRAFWKNNTSAIPIPKIGIEMVLRKRVHFPNAELTLAILKQPP